MLQDIEITRLVPHPNNPRSSIGDLTELTESIKANGILQNLTVAPVDVELFHRKTAGKKAYTGSYTVVIGHRRMLAAKEAGLPRVPCSIAVMDEKTQIATMLLENIQRADLTMVEQAQGLQMMLDLGDSYKEISRKTGISESTVRGRVKLVKTFGREALEKVQERPINLSDYEKLYNIKDPAKQTEVFNKLGTRDFDWSYKSAVGDQERHERSTKMEGLLAGLATQTKSYGKVMDERAGSMYFSFAESVSPKALKEYLIENLPESTGKELFYYQDNMGICVYTKKSASPADMSPEARAREERAAQRKANLGKLKGQFKQAFEMRLEFAKDFRVTARTKHALDKMAAHAIFAHAQSMEGMFRALFGIEKKFRNRWEKEDGRETFDEALARITEERSSSSYHGLEYLLFAGAYCRLDSRELTCVDYGGRYEPNEKLTRLYAFLKSLGYVMSEEEEKLIGGEASYYTAAEDDEDDEEDDSAWEDWEDFDE